MSNITTTTITWTGVSEVGVLTLHDENAADIIAQLKNLDPELGPGTCTITTANSLQGDSAPPSLEVSYMADLFQVHALTI